MINSTIAHKIKQRRKELRLTGIEMGNRLGISQQHYSRIENGNIKITVELLFSIAFILNMTPQSLLPNYNLLDKKSLIFQMRKISSKQNRLYLQNLLYQ
nr:helix-turn-helix transcriptional regulator [Proteus mirabilis]